MERNITYVGLDAHKNSIHIAVLGAEGPVEWRSETTPSSLRRMAKKIQRVAAGEVLACYEAGPCGYALQRTLNELGVPCQVIAPGLIPQKSGDRIKTDKRDARKLAELLRAGLLTEVHPPTEAQEAVRDLCRAREDAVEDRLRARHRLGKFLARHGVHYGRTNWTKAHRQFLSTLRFDQPAAQVVFEEYLNTVDVVADRVASLEREMAAIAKQPEYARYVEPMRCFRGIDTVTALTVVAELGDVHRFSHPRKLMAYLGLVPSEHSSGPRTRRGGITKTGNGHVRRVLVESAWHNRHFPRVGKALEVRRREQPSWAIQLADRAMKRLHHRYRWLVGQGKPTQKTTVAVARELAGFIWALFHEVELRA